VLIGGIENRVRAYYPPSILILNDQRPNVECRMQNAECRMQNSKCKMCGYDTQHSCYDTAFHAYDNHNSESDNSVYLFQEKTI